MIYSRTLFLKLASKNMPEILSLLAFQEGGSVLSTQPLCHYTHYRS